MHKDFLNEKSINEKGKAAFTHRRDEQHIRLLSEIWLLSLLMRE